MSRAGLTSFLEMCEKHQGSSGLLAAQQLAICVGRKEEKKTERERCHLNPGIMK